MIRSQSAKRILIVEDEGLIALDLQNRLERLGYTVAGIANRGQSALEATRRGECDLVLLDIRLKGEPDGIETARQIRSWSDIPIIYLTAHSDAATLERARLTDPAAFLAKPLTCDLRPVIELAFDRHASSRKLADRGALLGRP